MRALGPGSLSSLLKLILDVVYVGLWVAVGGVALGAFTAMLFSVNPSLLDNVRLSGRDQLLLRAPAIIGGLVVASSFLAAALVIVGAQRRIFSTLIAGDPFHPDNVGRLRAIAAVLGAMELGRYVIWAITRQTPWARDVRPEFSFTAWFSVLVVVVLAEVFREGARLRREAELTI